MLDFPIVDTHLHLWDPAHLRYPWLDDLPTLNRPHLPDDYRQACGQIEVEKMVFLQCECDFSQFQQEVDWISVLAQKDRRIEGIVAWAPLEKGKAARGALERLAENPLLRGIRRIIQFEEDIEFCLQPDFVKGVQMLPEFDMSFDVTIVPLQMENTVKLIRQCPDVHFMIDHCAKPQIREGLLEPWKTHMRTLSEMPNVWCKVSGLVTEADKQNWTQEQLKPYIDHVIDCFSFDRMVFGGDWPVVTLASEYTRWFETLCWAVEDASQSEKRKLFHDNAIIFYRLR
ncbi:MAG: amidohydrolase family protein [Pirellulales bacterium]|nr:amidohydrolase family protein [Pirellulales bacterium]